MHRIVVLGVGTEIGKTWVASALARSAPTGTCLALKPIETGCPEHAPPADAAALAGAAGHEHVPPLYCFGPPVTPWLAAEAAGLHVELSAIADWVQQACGGVTLRVTSCIVETAGGVFSPLSAQATNLDLAHVLEPATWVLVARNRLGMLHDVGATVTAMRALRRPPDVIVANEFGPADSSTSTNLGLLRRLHPAIHIVAATTLDPPRLDALLRLVAAPA